MPWCPKCRSEYREGFETCSECGAALVDELPEEVPGEIPEATETTAAGTAFEEDDVPALLTSAAGLFEAEILESKLEAYGVPVLKRNKGSGDYLQVYMGASPFGIDLYVPSRLLDRAREILQTMPEVVEESGEDTEQEPEGDEEQDDSNIPEHQELDGQEPEERNDPAQEYQKRKGRALNILFWVLVIPLLIILLYQVITGQH